MSTIEEERDSSISLRNKYINYVDAPIPDQEATLRNVFCSLMRSRSLETCARRSLRQRDLKSFARALLREDACPPSDRAYSRDKEIDALAD